MAEAAEQKQGTALEHFMGAMLPPDKAAELYASLPKHIKKERFDRNLINLMMQTPELMRFDHRLVFREISKVALLGLYLDKDLGEAYLISAYNYKTQKLEPQARIGYRGLIKLAKQSGKITKVYARVVHQGDQYDVMQGTEEAILHRPVLHGDPGPVIEYYAVAKFIPRPGEEKGDTEFECMSIAEIHEIRDRSEAWKAFRDGKIKSTPWSTDEREMAKKTVIRRLAKRLDMAPELLDAVKIEDEAEWSHLRDVTPKPTLVAPPAPPVTKVSPSPSTQQKRLAPKRTSKGRDETPYAEMAEKQAEAKAEGESAPKKEPKREAGQDESVPADMLRYSEEESAARLDKLIEDLREPVDTGQFQTFVKTYFPVVHRMIPNHQRLAEQRLARLSEEVTGNRWTFGTKFAATDEE